jgi:hypothetical protein
MRSQRHRMPDLFETSLPAPLLSQDLHTQVKLLLQALLVEAAEIDGEREAPAPKEAPNDEDHR